MNSHATDVEARTAACTALVDTCGGDTTLALLLLARHTTIAVAYLDRAALEAHVGRHFIDEEWHQIAPSLDGYDEWLDHSGAAESIGYWIHDVLLPTAGVNPDDTPADGDRSQDHRS